NPALRANATPGRGSTIRRTRGSPAAMASMICAVRSVELLSTTRISWISDFWASSAARHCAMYRCSLWAGTTIDNLFVAMETTLPDRRGPAFVIADDSAGPSCRRRGSAAAGAHGLREAIELRGGGVPVDARVGDRLAVVELVGLAEGQVLTSRLDEALEHQSDDALLAGLDALGDIGDDVDLLVVVLAAVAVARVDDDTLGQTGLAQAGHGVGHGLGVVVRAGAAAAQDDVAVRVADGLDERGLTVEVGAGEDVAGRCGAGAVDRDLHVTFGGVLDADGHGQRAAQLAVDLARGGAGTDGSVGDQVGVVLREDRVEELATDGQAETG